MGQDNRKQATLKMNVDTARLPLFSCTKTQRGLILLNRGCTKSISPAVHIDIYCYLLLGQPGNTRRMLLVLSHFCSPLLSDCYFDLREPKEEPRRFSVETPLPVTQGWARACAAVYRRSGCFSIRFCIRCLASGDISTPSGHP